MVELSRPREQPRDMAKALLMILTRGDNDAEADEVGH